MAALDDLITRFDPDDPDFIADPYPLLNELREATPLFLNERTGQLMLTRFADVNSTLRDRRLGRQYTHLYSHAALGRPEPDERWSAFHQHEQWSLLCLEPPDHTRIRRLVSKVFTPKAVATLRPAVERFSAELLDSCRELGEFELLADYAQPFSVAVICSMLGVPRSDTRLLLDWSHAIVKMYELSPPDHVKAAANAAAAEYIEYTKALIAEKKRTPDGLLVAELAAVEDDATTWCSICRRPTTSITGSHRSVNSAASTPGSSLPRCRPTRNRCTTTRKRSTACGCAPRRRCACRPTVS